MLESVYRMLMKQKERTALLNSNQWLPSAIPSFVEIQEIRFIGNTSEYELALRELFRFTLIRRYEELSFDQGLSNSRFQVEILDPKYNH